VHGSADDGAGGKAANYTGGDRATARFSRLRGGHSRESNGRGGRKCSQGFSDRHGAPSFGSLRSYAFNDHSIHFLHIFTQHQQSS
jgi:hypothetical protein